MQNHNDENGKKLITYKPKRQQPLKLDSLTNIRKSVVKIERRILQDITNLNNDREFKKGDPQHYSLTSSTWKFDPNKSGPIIPADLPSIQIYEDSKDVGDVDRKMGGNLNHPEVALEQDPNNNIGKSVWSPVSFSSKTGIPPPRNKSKQKNPKGKKINFSIDPKHLDGKIWIKRI